MTLPRAETQALIDAQIAALPKHEKAPLDHETIQTVETLKGEYVRKLDKTGKPQAKVYKVVGYDRQEKKWQLDDCDDCSRCVYVKKGTKLSAGFTY